MCFDEEPDRDAHDECHHEIRNLSKQLVAKEAELVAARAEVGRMAERLHETGSELERLRTYVAGRPCENPRVGMAPSRDDTMMVDCGTCDPCCESLRARKEKTSE